MIWIVPYVIIGIIAIPITYYWSIFLFRLIRHHNPNPENIPERIPFIPLLIGVFERAIITTLVGFSIPGAAAFIGTWVLIKAAGGWQTWGEGKYARAVLFVGLLGSALSIVFALVAGIILRDSFL